MHVVGTVVDRKANIAGLILRGKEKEFGGSGNDIVEKRVPIAAIPNGLETSEIIKVNGKIKMVGNFRLSHLDRMELLDNNSVTPISNNIGILTVVKDNSGIAGFEVGICNNSIKKRLRYNDLVAKAEYFKPTNFVVRDINGKDTICGKPGVARLEDFPVIDLTNNGSNNISKSVDSVVAQKNREYEPIGGVAVGILDIFDYVNSVNGYIALSGKERYNKHTATNSINYEGFNQPCKIEVATPQLKYGEKKINATLAFKKYGYIVDEESGKRYNLSMHASKSILVNGKSVFRNLCVLIDEKGIDWFRKNGIRTRVLMDETELKEQETLPVFGNRVLVEVSLDDVGVMSDTDKDKSILSAEQLRDACIKMYTYKLILKYIGNNGELVKGIKQRIGKQAYAQLMGRGINRGFAGLSKEELTRLRELGVDIITGEYSGGTVAGKKSDIDEGADIIIDYIYGGMDYTKVTGKQMVKMAAVNDTSVIPDVMVGLINTIECTKDDTEKLEKVKKIKDDTENKLEALNRTLWQHRAAMFMNGGGKYIHTHDREDWSPDETSRAKKVKVYKHKNGMLVVRFNGVEI